MFERFAEKARRVIFFARYEASQFGAKQIEPGHLALGLLREDQDLFNAIVTPGSGAVQLAEAVRARVEEATGPVTKKIATSIDMPLRHDSRSVLEFAAEEGERALHRAIGTPQILAGLLRVLERENPGLLKVFDSCGVTVAAVREYAVAQAPEPSRDALAKLIANDELVKLIGRIPESRLGAAMRLLEGLRAPVFMISGVDARGPFSYSFGPDVDPHAMPQG